MFDLAEAFPEQVEQAFRDCASVTGLPRREDIESVVVVGMGGSGIAGDVLHAVASPLLPVPVTVVKGYECPHFVDETTLVFAVSCSGGTEETIEAASDAALAGAKMVVVTSGGELGRLAEAWKAPLVDRTGGSVAAGRTGRRWRCRSSGSCGGSASCRAPTCGSSGRSNSSGTGGTSSSVPGAASEPAELARRIGPSVPIIHGGGPVGAVAAQRWKAQVNENAKRLAFWSSQPELCHNEICGWAESSKEIGALMSLVMLRHDSEHPQIARRFEITADLVRRWVASVVEVRAQGEGDLAQLFDLTYFGDYVSLWLAADAGIDPGPVEVLTWLKQQLAGR